MRWRALGASPPLRRIPRRRSWYVWRERRRDIRIVTKGLSSISSPHISSASVGTIMPFFRSRRVERRRSLFLMVGVRDLERLLALPLRCERRGVRVSMADSSSEDTELIDDAAMSVRSSTKPMPGARGVCATGWWAVGSLFRRQERAKTPARRMMVPRAIY